MDHIPTLKDHDLLIRLDQKVDLLTDAIKDIKDDTINRVQKLEDTKLDKEAFEKYVKSHGELTVDEEKRIRKLEKVVWSAVAIIFFSQILIGWYFSYKASLPIH